MRKLSTYEERTRSLLHWRATSLRGVYLCRNLKHVYSKLLAALFSLKAAMTHHAIHQRTAALL